MPINIYKRKNIEKITCLSDDDWELPSQIYELEKWLKENELNIFPVPSSRISKPISAT